MGIDLTEVQTNIIHDLLNQHVPDLKVWLYGSRIKGTSRPSSDLDMVIFAKPEHRLQIANLKEAFEESNLPFRVDVFVWDELPSEFQATIKNGRVVSMK